MGVPLMIVDFGSGRGGCRSVLDDGEQVWMNILKANEDYGTEVILGEMAHTRARRNDESRCDIVTKSLMRTGMNACCRGSE
jgi:hypothetical protein